MKSFLQSVSLLGLVVLLWGCSPELGQLGGVAKNLDGQPLGFAEVQLGRKAIRANSQGQYLFNEIPPGSYLLSVSVDGFIHYESMMDIEPGLQRFDIALAPESVEVTETIPDTTAQGGSEPEAVATTEAEVITPTLIDTQPEVETATSNASEPKILDFKLPLPGGYDWLLSTAPGGAFYGGDPNPGHRGRSYYAMDIIDNNKQQGELNGFPVPILASADGTVIEVRNNVICRGCEFGYGNYVKVDHGGGFMAVYAHLRYPSVTVNVGDDVRQGHVLGFMGTTGHSTGIHLHFEIRFLNEGAKQASVLNSIEIDGIALSSFKVGTVSKPKYYQSSQQLP
jgi:hypothetical protein